MGGGCGRAVAARLPGAGNGFVAPAAAADAADADADDAAAAVAMAAPAGVKLADRRALRRSAAVGKGDDGRACTAGLRAAGGGAGRCDGGADRLTEATEFVRDGSCAYPSALTLAGVAGGESVVPLAAESLRSSRDGC